MSTKHTTSRERIKSLAAYEHKMDFRLFQKVLVMASPIISGRYSINHPLNNPPRQVELFEYLLETFGTGPIQQTMTIFGSHAT